MEPTNKHNHVSILEGVRIKTYLTAGFTGNATVLRIDEKVDLATFRGYSISISPVGSHRLHRVE